MPTFNINGKSVLYTLRLDRRRKTIQLRVLPSATVEIVTPSNLTKPELEQIFMSKSKWLSNRLNKIAVLAENPVNRQLISGSQVLYQGQPHTLTLLPGGNKPELILSNGNLQVKVPQHYVDHQQVASLTEQIVKAWFVNQARTLFFEKTKQWADVIGVCPAKITIKDQKTRWGSCSSLGNINYNWRIVMAPPRVADYLVIHELCHILVPNHSAKFWKQVRRFCPNYQECRKWLRDNGKLLSRLF